MHIIRSLVKLISVICFISGASGTRAETVTIVAGEYKGVLEASGKGVLWQVHKLVAAEAEVDANFTVLPMRRARHGFYAGHSQGLFAVFTGVDRPVPVVYSAPFAKVNRYIFTAPGHRKLTGLTQLAGKKLGLVLGHVYSRLDVDLLRLQQTEIQTSPTQLNNVRMLISGRVDAILGNAYGIGELLTRADLPALEYDFHSPVTQYEFAYAFHDNLEGRILRERFSHAIVALTQSGQLARLTAQFEQSMNGAAEAARE